MREALVAARDAATTRVADLTRTVDDIVGAASMEALDDEHDPDGATVGFERAQAQALLDAARHEVGDLDEALARLDAADPSYGRCETCRRPISVERLVAVPTARTCVACAGRHRPPLARRR